MARLLVFLGLMVSIGLVLTLSIYKSEPVANVHFNYKIAKDAYKARLAEIEEIKKAKALESMTKKEQKIKPKVPTMVLDTPQLVNGDKVYKKCIVCHGKMGNGKKSQNAPNLAGQFDWYLEDSIKKMKNGERVNKIMMPYIQKLSDNDIKDVSHYLSKLK